MNAAATPATPTEVRHHYDRLSILYRHLWGEHIHHGFWENGESSAEAQLKLIRRLAERGEIQQGARVLDIGCGIGGASLWLARELGCSVHGITISPAQKKMADKRARKAGLADRVHFEVHDANELDFPPESFDAVWVIECSEHLENKPAFFRRCAAVLKQDGSLALCAWLAAERDALSFNPELVEEVCQGMLCPSLGSMRDHISWMRAAGLTGIRGEDITRQVERTWELCERILDRPWVRALVPLLDANSKRFAASFRSIRRAYAEDAMAYGMITATKPPAVVRDFHRSETNRQSRADTMLGIPEGGGRGVLGQEVAEAGLI